MRIPWWAWAWPAGAWLILLLTPFLQIHGLVAAIAGAALIATVFAAVYHAEVVAHRTGEPFGTLVLAVAVTVIEVALIVIKKGVYSRTVPRGVLYFRAKQITQRRCEVTVW